jgi:hypothetical protein
MVGRDGVLSGDWLIVGREGWDAGEGSLGVEKAPVDCFCRRSKTSWSDFGRRGGAGPALKVVGRETEVVKARRERRRGRRVKDDIVV